MNRKGKQMKTATYLMIGILLATVGCHGQATIVTHREPEYVPEYVIVEERSVVVRRAPVIVERRVVVPRGHGRRCR